MNFLSQITEKKQEEISGLYKKFGLDYFLQSNTNISRYSFKDALLQDKLSLIAEIKKASPSKGLINSDFNPVELGKKFHLLGAKALSILTERDFFLGDVSYVSLVKSGVALPVLRKDFILDPIQVYESRFIGSDAILLIKALLDDTLCQELLDLAKDLGLDVLVEVHSELELRQVLALKNVDIIGINNRDLKSFEVDTTLAQKILPLFNNRTVLSVAESGYQTSEQLKALDESNFSAVLIGEGLIVNPSLISFFKD